MAGDALEVVELRDDFYRDSFGKIILLMISIIVASAALVSLSVYIFLQEPPPITFPVYPEWRIQSSVPMDQPYLSAPDLLQWVSETIPRVFVYDFYHYDDQLKSYNQYFTADGWKVFLNHMNTYANNNNIQSGKLFINGAPSAAPYIINQGLLSGRYGWWVQIPIDVTYTGLNGTQTTNLQLQILVVRVSTLNNLSGVAIDNVIVAKTQNGTATGNG